MFDNPLFNTIVVAVISGIVGPVIIILVSRYFDRSKSKGDYSVTLQEITEQAIKDLKEEKESSKRKDEEYRQRLSSFESRLREAESRSSGPFLVKTKFITMPSPTILEQTIELVKDTGIL